MSLPVHPAATLDLARDTALRALDLLHAHGQPPLPLHYAVAFEYLHHGNSELARFLSGHLGAGKPLDGVLLQDLYEKYVAAERHKAYQGMRNDLQNLLQALVQGISETSASNAAYRAELESSISRLGNELTHQDLRAVAAEMVSAALAAQGQSDRLRQHLQTAQQEADQLRAELEAQRREAMIDPLTGLFNRRAMELHIGQLWAGDASLCVLVLDIDHFKRVNDRYGHAVGDIVIRNVADTVRRCIRGEDVAIRFGGEEFMVLLPDTALAGALTVAETIRKRIEALRLVRKQDNFTLDPFTISLGVAERRTDDSHDTLFERADKALYHAKSSGRNRVVHERELH